MTYQDNVSFISRYLQALYHLRLVDFVWLSQRVGEIEDRAPVDKRTMHLLIQTRSIRLPVSRAL